MLPDKQFVSSEHVSRRQWLQRASGGFGAIALQAMLGQTVTADDPLSPRLPHHPATADSVIFIYSTGGVSQVDTFDYKPQLQRDHGKSFTASRWLNKPGKFDRFLTKSRWGFQQYGENGIWVSELFPCVGTVIDDLCILNAMHCDSDGHDKATLAAHGGSAQSVRPSAGAWVSYGLGTENRNLPSFMVIAPSPPYAGAQTWSSDFLPGVHQGTQVVPGDEPLPNLRPNVPTNLQELELSLLMQRNRTHLENRGFDSALETRIRSFETAFGMQKEAPEVFDLATEPAYIRSLYGLDAADTSKFAWQCLVARRLVERGVRFIELIDVGSSNNWDSHGNMQDHVRLAKAIDQPIAGLITDLKQRGLLSRTLVVWTSEFGRTPFHQDANHPGREHHNLVFTSWMAGGGIHGGLVYGKSDEYGILPVEGSVHTHDFHATILHTLGLDHERLTYRHAGRDYRLTDIAGKVIRPILQDGASRPHTT